MSHWWSGRWIEGVGAEFVPLARLPHAEAVDVAIGCLGSDAAELDVEQHLPEVRRLALDIGTPRNFASKSPVRLLAIQDLLVHGTEGSHGDARRAMLAKQLREKLERRLGMAAADSQSTVGALRLEVEKLRQIEMERIEHLHPSCRSS